MKQPTSSRGAGLAAYWAIKPSLSILLRRYVRFGVVGASGVAVDMVALVVLADPKMLALNLSLSKALAAEVALMSNFIWNECWTFRDLAAGDHSWQGCLRRFAKFNLICLAGIGWSVLLLNLQTRLFQMNIYLANLIAILLVSLWNFGFNLKFGWKNRS